MLWQTKNVEKLSAIPHKHRLYPAWQLLRGRVVLPLAYVYDCARFAGIAQLVEQRIRNAQVMGSSPFTGSTTILYLYVFPLKTACLGGFFLPFHPCFLRPDRTMCVPGTRGSYGNHPEARREVPCDCQETRLHTDSNVYPATCCGQISHRARAGAFFQALWLMYLIIHTDVK